MKLVDLHVLRDSLSLLPKNTPKKLILLVIFQISIFTLDIAAILLLGVTTKLGLDYVQNRSIEYPIILTRTLRIQEVNFEIQTLIVFTFIVVLFSVRTVFSIWSNKRVLIYLANKASFASKQFVEKILHSKPQSVISKDSQEFLHGITIGIDSLTIYFLGSLTVLFTETFFLTLILIVLIIMQPITGIIALAIFVFAAVGINKLTSEKAREYSAKNTALTILYNKKLLDTLLVYRELYLRKREIAVTKEVQGARSEALKLRGQLMMLPTLSKYLFELTLVLGGAITALIQIIISDALTAISSVTIFLAAASRVLPSLIRAQGSYLSMRQSEGGSEVIVRQLRELEKEEIRTHRFPEVKKGSDKFTPNLKIKKLNFRYDEDSSFSLNEIEFEVTAGQFVAIVGESGSGKTTLIDLILGMQMPKSGALEISNLSPLEAIYKWPGKIAYVPQDIAIIDGSIKKNIVLEESREIPDEEVLIALDKSHLKDEVLNMRNGLNEIVGERGIRLSGGQRQRLGIARALFTKPEMIIFDEATSSLDPLTEKTVTEAIYEKKGNVTLIVVAHRLSTVKNADLVVLLDKGKILAKGTFEEVRRISPKFNEQAKLVNL